MTIEERAKYAQSQHKDESKKKFNPKHIMNFSDWEYGWCQGVTEQRKIDIDKACEWLYEWNRSQAVIWANAERPRISDYTMNVSEFRKAMED